MHYFIRYNHRTGAVSGCFRTSSKEFVPAPLFPEEENLEITDAKQIALVGSLDSRTSRLTGAVDAGRIRTLKIEPNTRGRVELSCDLPDLDGDGMPELPADGVSVARLTARVFDHEGHALKPEDTRVSFRVTRGTLSSRATTVVNGKAEVDWKSPTETVEAHIAASAEGYQETALTLEFIPADEYRTLSAKGKK